MRLLCKGRNFCNTLFLCLLSLSTALSCQSRASREAAGPPPSSEAHFETGTSARNVPFRIVDNNMYLTIEVNDSVEVEVAFDSGFPSNGVLIIDPAIGERLGLQYVGQAPLGGAGDESSVADVAQGATITLPGVSFENQLILVARNAQRYEKWLARGIIGGTILNSCVAEIDHEKSVLNLYKSDSFEASASGEAFDVVFSQGIPVIKATLEQKGKAPVQVKLLVDTGADLPFSLHSNHGLELLPPQNAPKSYISEGIKGEVRGQWSRIDAIHLGSFKMENCLVAYPTEGFDDVVAALGQNGFLGLAAQRRFTVTFDYLHSRMYLKPNASFGIPFEFNMAGLVLRTLRDGSMEVADVLTGSPGSAAGIRKSDRIVAIDGRNTSSIFSEDMERIFTRENQSLIMSIERDGRTIDVKLILKRMI